MVKISIKKPEKTIKPKQKQKQKQSQKVIVNIGRDVIKPKRRRRTGQALEKSKAVNKTNATPTQITVPQANPIYKQSESQNSMGEILRYIKESEQQKEMVKKQEKKNELEKDKKTALKQIPIEDAQGQFSTVNSQNISSLTSGSATPISLSRPIDSRSLFDSLMRVADIQGENPNSGRVSLTTRQSNPLSSSPAVDSFSIIGTINSSNRSNLSSNSSIITAPTYQSSERTFSVPRSTGSTELSVSSTQSANGSLNSFKSALTDYLTDKQDQPPLLEPSIDESVEIEEEVPPPQLEVQIEPPQEVINTEPLTVEPEPEQQLIVYEPEKANAQSATATQQIIGMDNSTLPAFLRPINAPLPAIRLNDIIGLRPTAAETKYIREERIKKLDNQPVKQPDKQPVLAIEDEPVDLPTISDEDMKKYKEQTKETRKAEETTTEPTAKGVEGYDDFVKYISHKDTYNWKLGEILIKNGITDPATGNQFYINNSNQVLRRGGKTAFNKNFLAGLLMKKYNDGLIKNYLN